MPRPRPVLAGLIAAVSAAAALVGFAPSAAAVDNGLARTPPMGFNDWNAVHCGVSEAFMMRTANQVVALGLDKLGYRYMNIDDCWAQPNRSSAGNLVPSATKFPHGIASLAAFMHGRGLRLGIYEDSGTRTCSKGGGFSGSLGHERQDAMLFATWGVDYLKYDDCNVPASGRNATATIARYKAMGNALAAARTATGQPIVFSICEKGDFTNPVSWSPGVGNLWRTTGDIHPEWARMKSIIAKNIPLARFAGPGGWNDPDMLEIGNAGMSTTEWRTEMSMWSEMAAPLLIGTDLTKASSAAIAILGNAEVIAVDQDTLGKQGAQVANSGGRRVLSKPLADGSRAVALYNETDAAATISTTVTAVGLPSGRTYAERDLWAHHTITTTSASISARVPAHGTVLLRVSA
jgi:alpha-galactosidase